VKSILHPDSKFRSYEAKTDSILGIASNAGTLQNISSYTARASNALYITINSTRSVKLSSEIECNTYGKLCKI
jgi:hypothetical protein